MIILRDMSQKTCPFLVYFYTLFLGQDIDITLFLPYTVPKPQYIVLLCQLTLYFVDMKAVLEQKKLPNKQRNALTWRGVWVVNSIQAIRMVKITV